VLGFGDVYKGNFQKLESARAHVAALPADDIVLFGDAYDVLYLGDEAALLDKYDAMGIEPSRVLFQAEKVN